ncbi:MAG: DUF4214 domain-containing protein [Clostridiales bacterium]|nr:DUF4214 domain-containing protein [Clostridiales bacterium]
MRTKFLTGLLAFTMAFSGVGNYNFSQVYASKDDASVLTDFVAENTQRITDFVTRLYRTCLEREPEKEGLEYWVGVLERGEQTGTSVASGFVFSPELQNKAYSDTQYVEVMYSAFFGREADKGGKEFWVGKMKSGMTRKELFTGFANSQEFFELCGSFDVVAGTYLRGYDNTQVALTNLFVERLYNVVLGRRCDKDGMMFWSKSLMEGSVTGTSAANGFFFSKEYENSRKYYSEYIADLYTAFMGRAPENEGFQYWFDRMMNKNATKEQIFNGFAMAPEFTNICSKYGILQGTTVQESKDTTYTLRRDVSQVVTPPASLTKAPVPTGTADPTPTRVPGATATPTQAPTPTLDPGSDPYAKPTLSPTSIMSPTPTPMPATKYSYEIIPILAPFNSYFYIKTDNPDPDSFRFVDKDTVYNDEAGYIDVSQTFYADVDYVDESLFSVNGGYIGVGYGVDGGELQLVGRELSGTSGCYNITTGETTYNKIYWDAETDVKISMPKVMDQADYLIETFDKESTAFFDRLSDIQSGFSSICLYSGASILGKLVKSESYPYYGLSNSPHVDQTFYIQSPYSRTDGISLLVSDLYPFRYDSIGFPNMMATIAHRIDASATSVWNKNMHAYVDITYNGTTKTYGGAGSGQGKDILMDQVNYRYSFSGSDSDAYASASLTNIKNQIMAYGAMTVPDDTPKDDLLTWADVRDTVGDGAYVKMIAIYSIFGSTGIVYTYLYDNGFANIGYMHDAWFDGRYYSRYEIPVMGTKFGDIVYEIDTGKSDIVIKDAVLNFKSDGNEYWYNGTIVDDSISNPTTGVWKGYTTFRYDEESGNWIARQLNEATYYENGTGYLKCTDQDFIDACTLTPEEVAEMNLDRNTDVDPTEYYVYDETVAPGTYVKEK